MNYPKNQMIKDYLKREITRLRDQKENVKNDLKYYAINGIDGEISHKWVQYLRQNLAQLNKDLKILAIMAKDNKQDIAVQIAINKFANKVMQDAPVYYAPSTNIDKHKWEESDPSELINYDELPSL